MTLPFLRPIPVSASFWMSFRPLTLWLWWRWLISWYFASVPISDLYTGFIKFISFARILSLSQRSKAVFGAHLTVLFCVPKHFLSIFCSSSFQVLAPRSLCWSCHFCSLPGQPQISGRATPLTAGSRFIASSSGLSLFTPHIYLLCH